MAAIDARGGLWFGPSRLTRSFAASFGGFCILTALAYAAQGWPKLLAALFFGAIGGIAFALLRTGVRVDVGGLKVTAGLRRPQKVAWADVEGFVESRVRGGVFVLVRGEQVFPLPYAETIGRRSKDRSRNSAVEVLSDAWDRQLPEHTAPMSEQRALERIDLEKDRRAARTLPVVLWVRLLAFGLVCTVFGARLFRDGYSLASGLFFVAGVPTVGVAVHRLGQSLRAFLS